MRDQAAYDPDAFTGLYRVGEPRRNAISYQVETLATSRDEALPLLERHYEEIAQFKSVQKLDPDWDAYEALQRAGKLWVMTARDNGVLVGYIVMIVTTDMHYRKLLRAVEDIHFILPEYRKGLTGYKMLARTVQAMRERGVGTVTFRTKANANHGVLFERLGGVLHDLVYTVVL
jgi:hypothetical protein